MLEINPYFLILRGCKLKFLFDKKWFFSGWELSCLHPSLVSASYFHCAISLFSYQSSMSCLLLCASLFFPQWADKVVYQGRWIVWDSNIDGGFDLHRHLKPVQNQSTVRSQWPSCPSFFPVSVSLSISCQYPFISLSISILPSHLFCQNY